MDYPCKPPIRVIPKRWWSPKAWKYARTMRDVLIWMLDKESEELRQRIKENK